MTAKSFCPLLKVALLATLLPLACPAQDAADFSPKPGERQVPKRMHGAMKDLPRVPVGLAGADILGADNRALQAAVDYIAGLGGGIVEIGPGEYLMRDSLHLRSFVTVRGTPGQTVLRKADGVVSPLALDGDFGEEQITVANPSGFEAGRGGAMLHSKSGGFHTTVARLTGGNGNTFSIDRPLNADCMVGNGATAATAFPVLSRYDIERAPVEHLAIEGNQEHNAPLDGCRGAGIFLYRGFGTVIRHCSVRHYNGDGISFQQSNDVIVADCLSEDNAALRIPTCNGSQ